MIRVQCITSQGALRLLSEPYLSHLKEIITSFSSDHCSPMLYFSYNAITRHTTIMTSGLNQLHLSMIQHFKGSLKMATQPEEIVRLLLRCFAVVWGLYAEIADNWERNLGGTVCSGKPPFLYWMGSPFLSNRQCYQKVWTVVQITTSACGELRLAPGLLILQGVTFWLSRLHSLPQNNIFEMNGVG